MVCEVIRMGEWFDKLKANPVMMVALVISIVGIFVAVYGFYKKSKWIKYAGIGLTAGGAFTAIGSYLYGEYGGGNDEGETPTYTGYGAASPISIDVTTPE